MKRPVAAPAALRAMKRPAATRAVMKRPTATSATPKRIRTAAVSADGQSSKGSVPEPKAKVFAAIQRCSSRAAPSANLLGVFGSAEAAIACASRAEETYRWKPGDRVRLRLYEEHHRPAATLYLPEFVQKRRVLVHLEGDNYRVEGGKSATNTPGLHYRTSRHISAKHLNSSKYETWGSIVSGRLVNGWLEVSPKGYSMPTINTEGTIRERRQGGLWDPVRYVVEIKHTARTGPPGSVLKQSLAKDKSDIEWERICREKRDAPTLRRGISGTTTVVEVPREYLEKPFSFSAKTTQNEEADSDGCPEHLSEDERMSNDSSNESEANFDHDDPRENIGFVVEENGLDMEVQDGIIWAAFLAANRCTPGEIRVCASLASVNTYAETRFEQRKTDLKMLLKMRKATSQAKEVSPDLVLGEGGKCLAVPVKHCFTSTHRDGAFLGGLCDYCEDDFSDLETDEEVDYTEDAYKEMHWVAQHHLNQEQPFPAVEKEQMRQPKPRTRKQKPKGKGEVYMVVRTSGQTENPWQDILGLYSDPTAALARVTKAELEDPFKPGEKMRFSIYKDSIITLKGTIRERSGDAHLEGGVLYWIDVNYDEAAKKIGVQGALLPADIPNPYRPKSKCVLLPGVEGTTSCMKVPRSLLRREEDVMESATAFAVEHSPIGGSLYENAPASNRLARLLSTSRCGLDLPHRLQDRIWEFVNCDVWVVCYEPSTTGWGDRCKHELFRSRAAANRSARDAFVARMRGLRQICSPDVRLGRPLDEPGRFCRLPPDKLFLAGYPKVRNFRKIIDTKKQCFAKCFVKGLFVGAISNFHGDHLDGCANPYMSEWWWVERRTINAPSNEKDDSQRLARKRKRQTNDCVVA